MNWISIIADVVMIILTGFIAFKQMNLDKKLSMQSSELQNLVSKRDAKINLQSERLKVYNTSVNTAYLLSCKMDIVLMNEKGYLVEYLKKLQEHELKLLECINISNFIFNKDEKIRKKLIQIHTEFANVIIVYMNFFNFAIMQSKNKSEQLYKNNIDESLKNIKFSLEKIVSIVSGDEYDELFSKYLTIDF